MGSVVPWTKTELCFIDLEEHHYTTYAHLFDKQLCQYLALNKDKLKLVAVAHTVRPDKKSLVEFLYVCDEFEGTPKVDGKEVSECTWVPVSNLLKEGVKIFEKPFSPFWQRFLKNEFKE